MLAAGERLVVACGDGALDVREVAARRPDPAHRGRLGARPRHRRRGPARVRPLPAPPRGDRRRRARRARLRRPRGGDRRGGIGGGAACPRPDGGRRRPARAAARLLALARPPEAAVFVNGRPDVAAALGAQGVQLAGGGPRAGRRAPDPAAGLDRPLGAQRTPRPRRRWPRARTSCSSATCTRPRATPAARRPGSSLRPRRCGAGPAGDRDRRDRRGRARGSVREPAPRASRPSRALWRAPDPAAAALALLAPWADDT